MRASIHSSRQFHLYPLKSTVFDCFRLHPRITVSLYLRTVAGKGIAEMSQNRSWKKSPVW